MGPAHLGVAGGASDLLRQHVCCVSPPQRYPSCGL